MPNDFAIVRDLIRDLRAALGNEGLIGMGMMNDRLVVSHARPDTGKPMIQMTFHTDEDYERDRLEMIAEFAAYSKGYYSSKDET